jgi:ABC-type arginine transport system ATPase subunit
MKAAPQLPISHLLRSCDLRCDGRSEPLAIADEHPEFSWQLAASSTASAALHSEPFRMSDQYYLWRQHRLNRNPLIHAPRHIKIDRTRRAIEPLLPRRPA